MKRKANPSRDSPFASAKAGAKEQRRESRLSQQVPDEREVGFDG
jgi:hypothetical protein